MMLAMLFQQTSMSWRTGLRRAEASTQVRSLFGAIQRDAVKAVAQNSIPKDLQTLFAVGNQNFEGDTLRFYTLSANGFEGDDIENGAARRSLSFIEYETSGKRTETILLAGGGTESMETDVKDFVKRVGNKNSPSAELKGFKAEWGGNSQQGLPLSVLLDAKVASKGYNLEIGAASAGPDGVWGTKDDIRTWAED